MMTADQVQGILDTMLAEGAKKPEIIRQLAVDCIGWPYVFGAWGEICTPANRRRWAREEHPTIVSKCQVLNGKAKKCTGCTWGQGVRMFDCRGFTHWLLERVGITIQGQGATSQWKTDANWQTKGSIADLPECVCCVFRQKGNTMEHTGMYLGEGLFVDCSVNVRQSTKRSSWTHFAVPAGLYSDVPVVIHPTLRTGDKGDAVAELQRILTKLGYDLGDIDGKFGAKTKAAVKAFQRDNGLTVDGVCGPATWRKLEADPEPLYKVTCEGVTWATYMKILEIVPTAHVEKDGE